MEGMEHAEEKPNNNINKTTKKTTPPPKYKKKTVNVILMIFVFTVSWSVIIYRRIILVVQHHDGNEVGHNPKDIIHPTSSTSTTTPIPAAASTISQWEHLQQPGWWNSTADAMVSDSSRQQKQNQEKQQVQDNGTGDISSNIYRHPNFHFDFPLCLVHIGKTAGSSISCGLGFQYADCEGMPRQELPLTYYFHMRKNNCLLQQQPQPQPNQRPQRQPQRPTVPIATFLFTVRNPLRRIQSWFEFEKNIVPTRKNKRIERQIRKRRGLLFVDCYKTFQGFVNDGLQIDIPSPSAGLQQQEEQRSQRQEKVSSKWIVQASTIWNMTCPERAWAAVLGLRDFSYHEYYNYDYYYSSILQQQTEQQTLSRGGGTSQHTQEEQKHQNHSSSTSFLVLRTEHLAEDWSNLSTEELFRQVNRRGTRGNVADIADGDTTFTISVGNITTTSETLTSAVEKQGPERTTMNEDNINWPNLCHALCDEIQVYKKILSNAHNLNRTQIDLSINEVREMCPDETIEVRRCDESTRPQFPSIKVTRQQYQSEPDSKKKFFEVVD